MPPPLGSSVDASPPGPPGRMVAGHFNRGVCYDTWRHAGTKDWLLMYTVGGRGRIGHLSGDVLANSGDVIVLRPGVRHDYGSEQIRTDWEFYWVHFLPLPDWMPWLAWPEVAPGILRVRLRNASVRQTVAKTCATMVKRNLVQTAHGEALAMNTLAEIFIRCDSDRSTGRQARLDARVERVVAHCSLNLDQPLRLDDLAKIGALSPPRFCRLFSDAMGMTPMRFLEQLRINRACRLLELSQAKIESVAQQVGFANPFYFTSRFKRLMGVSPRQYRQRSSQHGA
jgi:AraC family transcriptional regulator, arabinose operon regulatory protein